MAFKKVTDYNAERYGGMFLLKNDGDYADVVILYRNMDDVLMADVHYLKSSDYSGYVHCCGSGCPACARGVRVQNKLFIPVYDIASQEIKFFDRSIRFQSVLDEQVFSVAGNPSEYVFRITRHGAANSLDTTYKFTAVGKNPISYDEILAKHDAKFPDYYENICRDISPSEMEGMFNAAPRETSEGYSELPDYQIKPRVSAGANSDSAIPDSDMKPEPPDIQPESGEDDSDTSDIDNVQF